MILQDENETDDRKQTSTEINRMIQENLGRSKRVKITGLKGQNNIAVGMMMDCEIDISGEAGDLLGALNSGAIIILDGNCGDLAGDTLLKGGIIVMGRSGEMTGACMQNGIIVIKGDAGNGAGTRMGGGTLIIEGSVKGDLGSFMSDGTVIVTGDIKGGICPGATGGTVYLGGGVDRGLENVEMVPLTSKDVAKLSKYIDHYKISAQPSTMRKFKGGVLL
ncbi:MAG: hypothetical protein JXA22_00840 [Candidatus Thermoplasmatota archaeon]|nr:hypothetical protein [Candidatus Thermoplasmatota archaeon]